MGSLIQSFYKPGDTASLSVHQFGERFALSALADHSLNISMDLPNGTFDGRSIAVVKQITGQDSLSIEAKNRQPYSDKIRCKLLFGTNHPVELKVRDEAFANRILLIPFRFPVSSQQMNVNLLEQLQQEKSGIIYHALFAYRIVVQRNYCFTGEERFGFKQEQIQLPAQPIESLSAFVEQKCQMDESAFTPTEALHQTYTSFCRETGLPPIQDRSAFSRALKNLLGHQISSTKKRVDGTPLNGYLGIQLRY